MGLTLLAFLGCAEDPCPEGEIRQEGVCEAYEAGDPLQAEVWRPEPGIGWQWQLSGTLDTSVPVDVFDVDLVDGDLDALSDKTLICYFSAGSWEEYREDVGDIPDEALGKVLDGWPDERWWDIRHPSVREVLEARLDLAAESGCDAVEPDNVDGYTNDSGLPLNATEQLEFNRWLADEAHRRDLSVGLKNDVDQLEALQPWFDWALNEECASFEECGLYDDWSLAVFHVEYVDDWADAEDRRDEVCPTGFSTLIKTWDLGPEFMPCP